MQTIFTGLLGSLSYFENDIQLKPVKRRGQYCTFDYWP